MLNNGGDGGQRGDREGLECKGCREGLLKGRVRKCCLVIDYWCGVTMPNVSHDTITCFMTEQHFS